jgi:hypothetical protein
MSGKDELKQKGYTIFTKVVSFGCSYVKCEFRNKLRNPNRVHALNKILSTILLLFVLVVCLISYKSYSDATVINHYRTTEITAIRTLEWVFIESVIMENYDKADLKGQQIKEDIENKVIKEYPTLRDRERLLVELGTPNKDANIYKILNESIKGKYLNGIKNDSNDPFVASMDGVLADRSYTTAKLSGNSLRTWDIELDHQANTNLGKLAVESILSQSNVYIFWEPTSSREDNHILINRMSVTSLKDVFDKEGINGLKTYEFLKPIYIQEDTDIFGTPDVDNLGHKQQNYKLIVIQSFSITDVLDKVHKDRIQAYEEQIRNLNLLADERELFVKTYTTILMVILIFSIVIAAIVHNYILDIIEELAKAGDYSTFKNEDK